MNKVWKLFLCGTVAVSCCGLLYASLGKQTRRPSPVYLPSSYIRDGSKVEVGDIVPNCGLDVTCPSHHFSMHVYTGSGNTDSTGPRICVAGKYVVGTRINNGGRGLNVAVIDSHLQVVLVRRFDTYAYDDTQLGEFLDKAVKADDIVAIVTHDEAAMKLTDQQRDLLFDLGSAEIQNLAFRSHWYMVSQKGINGFTPFEKLRFARGNMWAPAIDERFCVPRKILGRMVHPDSVVHENPRRVKFCSEYNNYNYFCSSSNQNDILSPAALVNESSMNNPAYKSPVLVLAGNVTGMPIAASLETIIRQTGIRPHLVLVTFTSHGNEIASLAALFSFRSLRLEVSSYADYISESFEELWRLNPARNAVIVIEGGLLLSPDFLSYMSETIPVLLKDNTLIAVSAWNPYGYAGMSNFPKLIYRGELFPGLGFAIRKVFYDNELRGLMSNCCTNRSWEGWSFLKRFMRETLYPDISRVAFIHDDGNQDIFAQERVTNLRVNVGPMETKHLINDRYELLLNKLLLNSTELTVNLKYCESARKTFNDSIKPGNVYVVYFHQLNSKDFKKFLDLAVCLQFTRSNPPLLDVPLHKGLFRFSMNDAHVLLVGTATQYYSIKPTSVYS